MLGKIGTLLGLPPKPDAAATAQEAGSKPDFAAFVGDHDREPAGPATEHASDPHEAVQTADDTESETVGTSPDDGAEDPLLATGTAAPDAEKHAPFGQAGLPTSGALAPDPARTGTTVSNAQRATDERTSALGRAATQSATPARATGAGDARTGPGPLASIGMNEEGDRMTGARAPGAAPALPHDQIAMAAGARTMRTPGTVPEARTTTAVGGENEGQIRSGAVQERPQATDTRPRDLTAEFAAHRALLQAERRAQMDSADRGATPADRALASMAAGGRSGEGPLPARDVRFRYAADAPVRTGAASGAVDDVDATSAGTTAAAPKAQTLSASALLNAQAPMPASVVAQVAAAAGVTHPSILDATEDDAAPELSASASTGELRAGAAVAPIGPAGRADPAAIVRQLADAMPRSGAGSVEIRLNPEELGQVRMQLTQGESGLVVNIQAERAETLDLLRRHVDQLARDLAAAGHEAAGFTFGEGRNEGDRPERDAPPDTATRGATDDAAAKALADAPETTRPAPAGAGLDITI